jgi:DNA polymerase-3 subunit alpha/error-prone DNA polymerase
LSQKSVCQNLDIVEELANNAEGLVLATKSPSLLGKLVGKVSDLYAAITPRWLGSIPTARQLGIPLAAIDDASLLLPGDHDLHVVLRAIACGKTTGTLTTDDREPADQTIIDMERYAKAFESWPQALENTERIVSACADVPLFQSLVFPEYPVANSTVEEELRNRVIKGAEKRYGEISDAILGRITYELDIINRKGFASYFLVMDDIVAMASRTCGRGSGAASIVSYALGITNVDPIAYNLYFERFLTMARTDPPDIDVDFAWDERDDILHAVLERFGKEHCARVANHNRFRARSAIRETAKAYGVPDSDITLMERQLFDSGLSGITDPLWRTICSVASRIEGLPRGISMHCGGMVITPKPVSYYVPIESSAEGYPLLAWEKEGTEAAGLVKIDLLGNRSLAVIRDTLQNLREQGIHVDEQTWHPAEDRKTVEALARGDSMGVFYIESPAMRQLQQKTGRGDFPHIVIHSSIIRPAANKFISEYVRRLKGGPWEPLHPSLARILDETYGILCYQEDVSKTAVALAGFSEAEADTLRKVIAKKAGGEKLARYERQFFEGCRRHDVQEATIMAIWEMMLSFDGYSFCKPHSASYAMVSFQSAYLRVHHPGAFMAAVLSNQGGYYRAQAYISEARRMGLHIYGPDINHSRKQYHAEGTTIVVGLMAIANLATTAVGTILRERSTGGLFSSLEEASSRLSLQRDDLVSLVAAGAFDSLAVGMARSEQLQRLLVTPRKNQGKDGQGELFAPVVPHPIRVDRKLPVPRPLGRTEAELHREFEALGFLREHHPLLLWARRIARVRRIRAVEIPAHVGDKVFLLGWPITRKTVWTKQGLPMDFVSFEDETALYETVLFPKIHERYRKLLYGQRPLVVSGTVHDDQGALHVQVESMRVIEDS